MPHIEDYILLNMVENLGFKKLEGLLKFYGEPGAVLKASRRELAKIPNIGETIADKIASLKKEELDKELRLMEKRSVYAISVFDPKYPALLKSSYSPPIVLYIKGEIKPEDADSVAIVGARMPSHYGISSSEKLSEALASRGITIVSGMARGIDTAAHKGALKSGRTIAVLGSGLNNIYPPENKNLADEISAHGAVISEFPMDTPPLKLNFPRRNRIISGLSLGVVVVEAAESSGALITANFALEDNRDVFAMPGRVDSKTSAGTNKLIKEGAKLIEGPDDIIEEIENKLRFYKKSADGPAKWISSREDLTKDELAMTAFLSYEPSYIDDLVEKSNMSVDKVASVLVRLEIKNIIQELPGKNFILK
ncbi:MAG: DNA-processing protein DprA [Candidatus Omnitrophota bacterium]